jgi:hypothetical protein
MGEVASPRPPFNSLKATLTAEGEIQVTALLRNRPQATNSRTCLALNASEKMKFYYGISETASDLYQPTNEVEPAARRMVEKLASLADDKGVDTVYWECGRESREFEPIGKLSVADAGRTTFAGPKQVRMGRSDECAMLPVLRYFQEGNFAKAEWAIGVIVTDALIADLDEVKESSRQLAREIAAGERAFVKLVVIGVTQCLEEGTGERVMKQQLTELDELLRDSALTDPQGQPIDIWLHRVADTMAAVGEAFAEVIAEVEAMREQVLCRTCKVYETGRITDPKGKAVFADFADGVPGLLQFSLPPKTRSFALSCPDGTFVQEIPKESLDELLF